jgi:hypothetical protein
MDNVQNFESFIIIALLQTYLLLHLFELASD